MIYVSSPSNGTKIEFKRALTIVICIHNRAEIPSECKRRMGQLVSASGTLTRHGNWLFDLKAVQRT